MTGWKTSSKRPEDRTDALQYYESGEGRSHTETSAVKKIQEQITLRAVELLRPKLGTTIAALKAGPTKRGLALRGLTNLKPRFVPQTSAKTAAEFRPTVILDAGCGTGFSLSVLSELGFKAKGFDLSPRLVALARKKKLDAVVGDLRKIPFPPGSFGALISISALQWLLSEKYSDKEREENVRKCASEFWRVLEKGGKAAVQFYPKSEEELFWAGKIFKSAGFSVVVHQDNAQNGRKRKCFLLLEKP